MEVSISHYTASQHQFINEKYTMINANLEHLLHYCSRIGYAALNEDDYKRRNDVSRVTNASQHQFINKKYTMINANLKHLLRYCSRIGYSALNEDGYKKRNDVSRVTPLRSISSLMKNML